MTKIKKKDLFALDITDYISLCNNVNNMGVDMPRGIKITPLDVIQEFFPATYPVPYPRNKLKYEKLEWNKIHKSFQLAPIEEDE